MTVVAVDGGNFKTDFALLDASGRLLSLVRGGGSSPHRLGVAGCIALLEQLLEQAVARAGNGWPGPPVATAHILLAGADLPEERAALRDAFAQLGWAERLVVDNDTLALLRAGTDRGWGVAVVCGAGINCLGRAPDGREARFLSLGEISGDWGGGGDVGRAALAAAARSADGRGPRTALERAVAEHFGLSDPLEVARAVHLGQLPAVRLGELAAVVLAACEDDAEAAAIVDRLAGEVVAYARAVLSRLSLVGAAPEVVLGGRILRSIPASVVETIAQGIAELAPDAQIVVSASEPIVGAALLGLDVLGAGAPARARARTELDAAVDQVGVTFVSPAGLSGS